MGASESVAKQRSGSNAPEAYGEPDVISGGAASSGQRRRWPKVAGQGEGVAPAAKRQGSLARERARPGALDLLVGSVRLDSLVSFL